MAKKKSYKKPIMIPQADEKMQELRFEIAKRMEYTNGLSESWWDELTPSQQSDVNGMVTKMMIEKAKRDMIQGRFVH